MQYNHCNVSEFLNLGCGIPGETYQYFMKGFQKLDQEQPYDNGLNFRDASTIEYETSRKGNAIQMRYVYTGIGSDPCYRIVGFASIELENGVPKIGGGWKMSQPFEIG